MSGFTCSMFSKHATVELLLSRLHWSEVDLQLLVVPAGDSHASHVSRVRGRPWCPGPVSAGRRPGLGHNTSGHGPQPVLSTAARRRPQRGELWSEHQRKRPSRGSLADTSLGGCHGLRAWSSAHPRIKAEQRSVCDPPPASDIITPASDDLSINLVTG